MNRGRDDRLAKRRGNGGKVRGFERLSLAKSERKEGRSSNACAIMFDDTQ